jgi:hypothetical protein
MRVIFQTQRAASVFTDPRDSSAHRGLTHLEVVLYEAGDDLTRSGERVPALPLSKLLTDAGVSRGQPLRVFPPPGFGAAPVVIPPSAVSSLDENALLECRWVFHRRRP